MLPDEMQPPKTRFIPGDKSKETRSTSSPRLKSFPAEKIRKLDNSPIFSPESVGTLIVQRNPQKTKTFFANSIARSNNGHGDAISAQFSPCCQQPKLQGISSPSQQQIAANHQQISQANPQSESLLTRRIASPERQVHRPFVPIAFQGTVIRDRSPRNPSAMMNQPTTIQNPSTQIAPSQMQQFSHDPRVIVDENRDETFDTYENQPVGGRNTINHRQMIMQMQQQRQAPIARDTNASLDVQSANNCHHMYDSIQQNPQQVYQQMQQSAYHPQTLQQPHIQTQSFKQQQQHQHQQQTHDASAAHCAHYVNRCLSAVQVCGQGMTSPQDMTVSQMKLMQHGLPIHQQGFGCPVNLHSAWPQNDRWMQTASQSRQVPLQQPLVSSPSRCQCCYQMQAAPNVNFDQQTFGSQDQSNPPQNHKSTNQQLVVEAANREDAGRKKLKFTPDMIRDQELLISTLRQQGVPDDVVRRHFDALLNEQRRHLTYIAQFSVLPDADMEIRRSHQPAQKRLERDEKPEWMVHITPPRISYYELEKMRAQQKAVKEQCTVSDQPLKEIGSTHVQQQNYHPTKQEELTNQVVPLKQMYFQVNPYQQQMANWSHKGAACCPHNHQQNALYRQPSLPLNVRYSYNMLHNPYNHPDQQKAWSEQHNPDLLKSTNDQRAVTEPVHIYEQSGRQVESSSLLKIRMYKEVIRPQKQNNGLQDPDTIQKALDALKDPTSRRGLEYLANLTKRKPALKLNGAQNPGEIPDELRSRSPNAVATSVQIQKRILANGLENSRNPNNPPPRVLQPKRIDEPMMVEYPRQRKNMGTRYSVQAERENDTTATSQQQDHAGVVSYVQGAQSIPYGLRNAPAAQGHCGNHPVMFQYGGAPLQHHYQMQQRCYLNERSSVDRNGGQGDVASTQRLDALGATRINRAGGDTGENLNAEEVTKRMVETGMQGTNGQAEVREARTIGGVTYLPRKPDYACNNLTVSPNQLIASGHLQPPRIL